MVRVESSDSEAYRVVVLPETGGAGHQEDAMRPVHDVTDARQVCSGHAQIGQGEPPGLLVEQPQHHAFAVARRHGRYPDVHLAAADPETDAAVLGNALFGDVQPAHDLDAGDQ